MNLLEPAKETWLHRVNPALKLAAFLGLFVVALLTHRPDFALFQAISYIALLFMSSGHSRWKMAALMLPFLLVFLSSSSTMILFGRGDTVWWTWGLLKISEESFYRGIHIGLKSVCCAAAGLLFALTTRPSLLFYALMQQFRMPPRFAYGFLASMRLLPIVWEEFVTRKHALQVRGVRYAKGLKGLYERLSMYAVPLLAQSIRRAQRIAVAMEAKRFRMRAKRTYYYATSYSIADIVFLVCFAALVTAAYAAAFRFPVFGIDDVRYMSNSL